MEQLTLEPPARAARRHHEACRRILVVVSPAADVERLLDLAVPLARERAAALSIVGIPRQIPHAVGCGLVPVSWPVQEIETGNLTYAERRCRQAVDALPGDVSADWRVVAGPPRRAIGALLSEGRFGAVVLDAGDAVRRRRALAEWRAGGVVVHVT